MTNNKSAETPHSVGTEDYLPYVIIQDADNNSLLYPLKAANGTTARIAFPGMGDSPITLYWAIKNQEEPAFEPIEWPGSTSGSVDVPIPWEWVSTCVGHTVEIFYSAMVAGELECSLVLELEIQHIRDEDFKESVPTFVDATGNPNDKTLDMYTFSKDAKIQVKAWPLIQEGQRLYINVAGDQHKPEFQYIWVAQDYTVNAAEAHADHVFEFDLPRGWLARREDYSALTAHIAVIFDRTEPKPPRPVPDPIYGSHLPENALEITPRTTVRLRVDPAIEPIVEDDNFNNYMTQQFLSAGSNIHTRLMRLELPLDSYHGIGLHVVRGAGELVPGMVEGMALALRCGHSSAERRQFASMHLKWKCTQVRFAYSGTHKLPLEVSFYDEHDNELGHTSVTPPGWVDFKAAQGDYITRLQVVSSYHGCVDSLTIWHEGDQTKEPRE